MPEKHTLEITITKSQIKLSFEIWTLTFYYASRRDLLQTTLHFV
jgi:hypothetical protein